MSLFPNLLSPFQIKSTSLRNRIFSTGHETLLVSGGTPDESLAAYHEARAKGGAALIITEATTVHESAFFNTANPIGYRRECIPGFRLVADAVHRHGTRVFGQLWHPGGEMMGMWPDGSRSVCWGPSANDHERYLVTSRAMPEEMIHSVINGYATTAANLVEAGYDGVEIVASHGYLPAQFLSARLNRRDDDWGGSVENRQRFLVETARAVRTAIPEGIILGMRISLGEKTSRGMNRDEATAAMMALQDAGLVDYLNLTMGSSGTSHANHFVIPPMAKEAGFMTLEAGDLKSSLSVPVLLAGRFNQPQQAELAIADNATDMVGMTRAQICDPELANKLMSGRVDEVRACIACNQACIGHLYVGAPISCIQHPETGRELEFGTLKAAERRLKVLVAGAGPAGMKASAVAAERGHEVMLCESTRRLGGQALLAQLLPERAEFGGIVTNLSRELEASGVEVRLETAVTRALVEKEGPDAVIIATGADPHRPEFEGATSAHVVTAWQVLEREVNCGTEVVIADWRGDWIGVGIAQLLALEGRHVRLVTSAHAPGISMQTHVRDHAIGELSRLNVDITVNARLFGVDDDTAYFQHTMTEEAIVIEPVETLVLALGYRSRDSLAGELAELNVDLHVIGDALSPRTAEEAVLEGLKVGASL